MCDSDKTRRLFLQSNFMKRAKQFILLKRIWKVKPIFWHFIILYVRIILFCNRKLTCKHPVYDFCLGPIVFHCDWFSLIFWSLPSLLHALQRTELGSLVRSSFHINCTFISNVKINQDQHSLFKILYQLFFSPFFFFSLFLFQLIWNVQFLCTIYNSHFRSYAMLCILKLCLSNLEY